MFFSSPSVRGGGVAGVPYPGAIIALDFKNGLYLVGGMPVALADAIDKPGFVAGGALQLRYVSVVPNDDLVFIQGDALAALGNNPQGTFVFDWTEFSSDEMDSPAFTFVMQDAGFNSALFWERQGIAGAHELFIEDLSLTNERDINNYLAYSITLARHRLAITRDNSGLRASCDGLAVVTASGSAMTDMSVAYAIFGGQLGNNLNSEQDINSLIVYAPVDDAVLPTLSAL